MLSTSNILSKVHSSTNSSGSLSQLAKRILSAGYSSLSGKGVESKDICFECGKNLVDTGTACLINHNLNFCGEDCLTKHKQKEHEHNDKTVVEKDKKVS